MNGMEWIGMVVVLAIAFGLFFGVWAYLGWDNSPPELSPDVLDRIKKMKRNDACSCGSKKNYKNCHMESDMEAADRLAAHREHQEAAFGDDAKSPGAIARRGADNWIRLRGKKPREKPGEDFSEP